MLYIPDIIKEVVESIRAKGVVSYAGVMPTPTSFEVDVDSQENGPLKAGEWVSMQGVNYQVLEVNNNTTIVFDTGLNSEPSTGTFDFMSLEPYFLYGHRMEISRRLLEKDSDDVYKYQKYPLVALRLPFPQSVKSDIMQDVRLNIAIMEYTEKEYTSEQRYSNVIKPILGPIYNNFIEALTENAYISVVGKPEHKRIDRLFWGVESSEGNMKYIFNDPLDAIEIQNLELSIVDSNC